MNADVQAVVAEVLEAIGYELFELRRGGTRTRPVLDVRIERRDGEKVTIDDCARASRAIEARLDSGELIDQRYVLEVSSPGVERALRHAGDWRRFVGRRSSVLSAALGGRVEVEIVGVEGEDGAEVVVVKDAKDQVHRVPIEQVKEARLVFHWKS